MSRGEETACELHRPKVVGGASGSDLSRSLRPYYIAIEGPIGVGKTTLARLMQAEFKAQLLLEVFEENPFLKDFYADRERYAFQTQVFFILSRYWQQRHALPEMLDAGSVISDYTFAKDRLFAHLNLRGDELETYERLYSTLAETIPPPELIVYLVADVSVLLERIALRDRSYERNISASYIEGLAQAYEAFFAGYSRGEEASRGVHGLKTVSPEGIGEWTRVEFTRPLASSPLQTPVLRLDTNSLDIVHRPGDLAEVMQRVRSALGQGTHQMALPQFRGRP